MSGEDSLRIEQSDNFEQVLENRESNGYVGRVTRAVEKGRMQSNAMNATRNRIHSGSERLDSGTAIILQKHRAREEPGKLGGADYVERNGHAKRDGVVPVEAFNGSRSMKVMGVTLRVQYENSMRCDKPSVTNLVSSTEVLL